uniref:Dirigent protein n=3 Tax=Musa TaxID=4640 RepID=A0A804K8I9_MUSAM|nr:PREDICTED: dirigent protein 1-like [Musa acuminata subsp. malaccensis]
MIPASVCMASSAYFLFLLHLFAFANVAPASGHVYAAPKEKMTHLHFYFHEIYGGPNTTTITVVNPPGNNSFNNFGSIGVGDNMLREGPNPSSKLIGRAQELAVQASLESPAYLSAFNFVFTAGEYNGSSISIFGRAVLTETMERGIIGGTGKFRMARGYTISRLIRRTGTTEIVLVVEYDAYIFHY